MFRSLVWEAVLEADRNDADAGSSVVVEELAPCRDRWEVRRAWTRTQLIARASAAAATLRARLADDDHHPPPLIALALPRSSEYVTLALVALAAGAAFMPLDDDALDARGCVLAARAAGAVLLVVPSRRREAVAAAAAAAEASQPSLDVASARELLLQPSSPEEQQQQQPAAQRPLPYYCLLPTSGSTSAVGAGKAVRLTEQALLRRCRWALSQPEEEEEQQQQQHPRAPPLLARGDSVVMTTPPCFVDHLAQQMFAPLLFVSPPPSSGGSGGDDDGKERAPLRLVIVRERADDDDDEQDNKRSPAPPLPPLLARPLALLAALRAARVTHFVAVPTVLAGLAAAAAQLTALPPSLRCVISSGEPLPVPLAEALLQQQPEGARLINLYGSTETSGDCAWLDVGWWLLRRWRRAVAGDGNEGAAAAAAAENLTCVPAGVPLDGGVRLRLRAAPNAGAGEEGGAQEVLVGGWCVAAGYGNGGGGEGEQEDGGGAFWEEEEGGSGGARTRWFATGDHGRMLPLAAPDDGPTTTHCLLLLHVDGRLSSSSFAKLHGARVDCAAIEAALLRHGAPPLAVRAWNDLGMLVAYVERGAEAEAEEEGNTLLPHRMVTGANEAEVRLLEVLQRAADAAGLPSRARPLMCVVVPRLPRTSAGKLLRDLLPAPPPSLPPSLLPAENRRPDEGAVLLALQSALGAVIFGGGGGGSGGDQPLLEPAEDVMERASADGGSGAASRVAVAAAVLLGIPAQLVLAFPSARLLARALRSGEGGGVVVPGVVGDKRPREEEEDDDDKKEWPPADEAWSAPMRMCVDAAPVVVIGGDGDKAMVAAASHGGEVAFVDVASATAAHRGGLLPGSLDAGLVPVVGLSSLPLSVAVVCRAARGDGCSLHLVDAGGSATNPPPLPLPSDVSSAPAAYASDNRSLLFLATHAPDPCLVVVSVVAGLDNAPSSWRVAATAPLPASSASTPLVLPLVVGESGCAEVVVATLDGALTCFAVGEQEEEEGGGVDVRQLWSSSSSSPSPIFGAPVAMSPAGEPGALLVVAARVDGTVRAVWARGGGGGGGSLAWETRVRGGGGEAPAPPPVFVRLAVLPGDPSKVLVAASHDGALHGLDGATGQVLWRLGLRGGRGRGGDRGLCSPAVVAVGSGNGVVGLVVAAHDGRVFGVRVEQQGRSARVVSEQRVDAAVYGAPVVIDGGGSAEEEDGDERRGAATTTTTTTNALVAIGCRDDRLRALRVSV
jgi:acyl-CoA synthetase (AMP-forming)/AMP-acid ligase II